MNSYVIKTHHAPHAENAPWMALNAKEEDKDKDIAEIAAESCVTYDDEGLIGYGMSEKEAIGNLFS